MHTGAGPDSLAMQAADAFRAFRDGDPSGMSTLVDVVTPLLWSVARQQGAGRLSAEDVVQNTWLKLVEHAPTIADPQSVLKWLIVTTKRGAWAVGSHAHREAPGTYDDVREVETGERAASPEAAVLAAEDGSVVWDHVAELPERCRTLLRTIAFAERPDYAQIAEALGMPVGSIGPTRGRCLAKLRAALVADPRWEMSS
ncbi:sigma-70 family RNA polymerase sigma factor [Nostocoides sp. Soil756]|jgi:RNA polymerase sigma factor (sigma-70 family)|uniref:RNA polymerase sigma factor n=1 Tax=Nostocoides sp. Soil756 TaxID=1736399 RepID=UPI0006FEC963|nr:sigma-70 family RNA polymerase sigma factor [Tetrasphaera sp. Soil756]KRE63740.1 hypothetical protein ASG78_00115 [Tetrasphaera sp. Soil756]